MSSKIDAIAWAQAELRCYLRDDEADGKHRRMAGIVSAALRIAARVAEPGWLETRLAWCVAESDLAADNARSIRTALTEESTNGR